MKKFFLLLSSLFGMNGHKNYGSNDVIQAVDLGLSVKWASCNVGASAPEKTGGYYAWGETEEKSNYIDETYKYYADGENTNIGPNICGTQYDVAHVKWGGKWRMPTSAELKELVDKCAWTWTTLNGVEGMKFIGPNGNSIFLPAAGRRNGDGVSGSGDIGFYWSGSLYKSNEGYAWDLYFNNIGGYDRGLGFSVRPVEDKEVNDSTKPVALTGDAVEVTSHSAKITCSFKNIDAIAQYGVILTSSNGTSSFQTTINNDDSCFFYLENLQPQITYTYQAYILSHGKSYYGDKKSFTTLKKNDDVVTSGTAIDLGLSVKWASCNVGASAPEDYGGYYAWGETEEKSDYTDETYKYYADGENTNIGPNICGTQYDVAHVKWGGKWRMPSLDELKELVEKCTWAWTTQNGVKGMKVTGPNGNSIFLPAAGGRAGDGVDDTGNNGYYWSGSLNESYESRAWTLYFLDIGNSGWGYGRWLLSDRNLGFQVRPVEDKEVNDSTKPVALTGDAVEVTSHSAKITCSFKNIDAIAQYGVILTSSNGTSSFQTTITSGDSCIFYLKNLQPQITYTYQAYILSHGKSYYGDKKSFTTLKKNDDVVTSGTAIDLGLSVKWASCNVGASAPEDYGGYYAWGETEEKSNYTDETYKYYADGENTNIGPNICGTQYDVAHVKWGGKWRMPTLAEQQELVNKCTWAWTTQNGVKGMKVTGPNGNSIFLPAAGRRHGYDENNTGFGYYWSGWLNESSEDDAWGLCFDTNGSDCWGYDGRHDGFQVRPVSEF